MPKPSILAAKRRQEAEEARQEKERGEAAARAARKTTFCVVYWLCGIALAVADVALLYRKVDFVGDAWGLGWLLFAVFAPLLGCLLALGAGTAETAVELGGFSSAV